MKRKNFINIIAVSIIFIFSFVLLACNKYSNLSEIKMKNEETIEVKAGDFSYDGIKVVLVYLDGDTEEIDLTDDMISDNDKLNFYKMGEHDITVKYSRFSTTMKINVVRHEFDDIYKLEGYTCQYDGNPHSVELNYELPEGAKIEYPYGNTFTNAGEYEVVGVITKSGYNTKTLKTTLVIEKADYDATDIVFNNKTYVYDGEAKTIEAENVPDDLDVTVDIYNEQKSVRLNNAVNAGTYTLVAKFKSKNENFNEIETREAKLTILKAKYDLSNVTLDDYEKNYDGLNYTAYLTNQSSLPQDISVSFEFLDENGKKVLSNANAGKYTMVANLTSTNINYDKIEPMKAELIVNKRLITLTDVVKFESKTINYDRNQHSLVVENLPSNVDVEYENNGQVRAGEYKILAHFTPANENEVVDIDELDAYLIINKVREEAMVVDEINGGYRPINGDDVEFTLNQETGERDFSIRTLDTDKYVIKDILFSNWANNEVVTIDQLSDGNRYNYSFEFKFTSDVDNDSVILSPATGTFECYIKFDPTLELVGEGTVPYDGNPHTFTLNKDLPEGAVAVYKIYNTDRTETFDEAINSGIYRVECKITKETYGTMRLEKVLKIEKLTYDMSNVRIAGKRISDLSKDKEIETVFYTGNPITLAITGLPDGVTANVKSINYFEEEDYNYQSDHKYNIEITFNYDEINHNPLEKVEFIFCPIARIHYDLSKVYFKGDDMIYNDVGNNNFGHYDLGIKTSDSEKEVDDNGVPIELNVVYKAYNNSTNPPTPLPSYNLATVGTYYVVATLTLKDEYKSIYYIESNENRKTAYITIIQRIGI